MKDLICVLIGLVIGNKCFGEFTISLTNIDLIFLILNS